MRRFFGWFRVRARAEIIPILLSLAVALLVRTAVAETYFVPTPSMVPTLLVGDQLMVSKVAYGYSRFSLPVDLDLFRGRILARPPERGDVVVFRLPRDTAQVYVKRLIGLPGDRIEVAGDGSLSINGEPAQLEPIRDLALAGPGAPLHGREYWETLPQGPRHRILRILERAHGSASGRFVVPDGQYFMMGDNRDDSLDSRYAEDAGGVGYVPAENLIGPVMIVYASIDERASFWRPWEWPAMIRFGRMMQRIE
ncbi:MAG: signal peptidase I [Proteobacteria bacterium]|nr:signal peptidase I [Pseudomonadota bacterium]MBI3498629.1 signal peptidase I [Pseudomonadota bacterium]